MIEEKDRFDVVEISEEAQDLMTEFRSGVFGYATTSGSRKVEEDSYAHMNVTKKALCTYLSQLEEDCGIKRNIKLRF